MPKTREELAAKRVAVAEEFEVLFPRQLREDVALSVLTIRGHLTKTMVRRIIRDRRGGEEVGLTSPG